MKTLNGKMAFGMGIVTVAKRGANDEPELIINPTVGGFRVTGPVTRALGIKDGEYIMFVSSVDAIDFAIAQKDEQLVAWCEENGINMSTPEGIAAIHKEFDVWGIAKGIQEFDAKGNPVKTRERITAADRKAYVETNFDALYEHAVTEGTEDFKAALTVEGITKDQQIELLMGTVQGDEIDKYRGAKCANSNNLKGIGNTLTFSDAGSWAALKAGADKPKETNRIYSVNVKDLQTTVVNNGYKDVEITFALLEDYRDEAVARRASKAEATEVAEETAE